MKRKKKKDSFNKRRADQPLKASDFWDIPVLASNRFGGNQLQTLEGLPGGTYGAASKGRRFSEEEKEALDAELRRAGRL